MKKQAAQLKTSKVGLSSAYSKVSGSSRLKIVKDSDPETLILVPPVNSGSKYKGRRYIDGDPKTKILGAVYTPPRVAAALTRWAVRAKDEVVLDPSCGEGVFLAAARTRLHDLGSRNPVCIGVDIDPNAARSSSGICSDFFEWQLRGTQVDVVIGNPPFIRSHLFPEQSRSLAFDAMGKLGMATSRLMSTWAPFLGLCASMVPRTGRLAMVIPEEFLVVGYASDLREYLLRKFRQVIISLPEATVFPEVQQAVVLVLCDNDESCPRGLYSLDYTSLESGLYDRMVSARAWDWNHKWSHFFLSASERDSIECLNSVIPWNSVGSYGRVEVGVVTGDNNFFVLGQGLADSIKPEYLLPIVASAKDLKGLDFDAEQFRQVARSGRPAYLLNLPQGEAGLGPAEIRYLKWGISQGVDKRYKCKIRKPWYSVPGAWAADAVMFRQAGDMARIVHLAKKCVSTDTVHRVCWNSPSKGRRHALSFFNTWTMIKCELTGRSYGGGVLEIMPGEANLLPLPDPDTGLDEIFGPVDQLVRSRDMFAALALVDQKVMPEQISKSELTRLREVLTSLIRRRKTRAT